MPIAAFHALCAVLCVGLVFLGRFLRRNPAAFVRFFTFGASDGTGFAGFLGKAVGWFWLVLGGIGVLGYLVMIPVDLLSSK